MAEPLTDRTLRSVIATATHRRDLWDSTLSGFGVRLSAGRHCSFVVRYRIYGRLRRFTIGPYPRISLANARQVARDVLRAAQDGKDLAAEKIDARRAETFAELADDYIARHASKKRSGREDVRLLKGSAHKKKTGKTPHVPLVKRWSSRKLKEITRRDVRDLVDDVAARGPIMANRVLALVRKMFNFAIERDWLEVNPCHMVKRAAPERQRDRVLTEDEVRAVWAALDEEQPIIAAVFRLRLLTAQRGGEVLGATWSEIDLVSGWWIVPAERSKNGLTHRVPLSPQAVKVLKNLRSLTGVSRWVVPSAKKQDANIAHVQKAIERVVQRSGVSFRGHDLRRTAASLMVGGGVPRLVVSKILNHVEKGVTAVYDRHSYDLEKRAALDFWGKRLEQMVSGRRAGRVLLFAGAR
jgi:integrase